MENSSFALRSPSAALLNNYDDYADPLSKDPYADIDKSMLTSPATNQNFNSQISLGIHHPQAGIRSAFKGTRQQTSMMESTISMAGAKLDLQRQAREDTINKRAIEVAKKKDRKALMELIQDRDRMVRERNQQEKDSAHNKRIDPVIATALNDSQRGSGAQSDVLGFADSLPRDSSEVAAAHRLISSSGDDEFTMYRQTNNSKVSSNNYIQSTGGNEQKRKQLLK